MKCILTLVAALLLAVGAARGADVSNTKELVLTTAGVVQLRELPAQPDLNAVN